MKVTFRSDYRSPHLEVADGDYHRVFRLEDAPIELSDEEWARLRRLVGTILIPTPGDGDGDAPPPAAGDAADAAPPPPAPKPRAGRAAKA